MTYDYDRQQRMKEILYVVAREVDSQKRPTKYWTTTTRSNLATRKGWTVAELRQHLHDHRKTTEPWVGRIDPETGYITRTVPQAEVGPWQAEDGT